MLDHGELHRTAGRRLAGQEVAHELGGQLGAVLLAGCVLLGAVLDLCEELVGGPLELARGEAVTAGALELRQQILEPLAHLCRFDGGEHAERVGRADQRRRPAARHQVAGVSLLLRLLEALGEHEAGDAFEVLAAEVVHAAAPAGGDQAADRDRGDRQLLVLHREEQHLRARR